MKGLEPTRYCYHQNLNLARLPIPPHPHIQEQPYLLAGLLVRETGLEPVRCNHTPLKRARLPVPPLPHCLDSLYIIPYSWAFVKGFFESFFEKTKSLLSFDYFFTVSSIFTTTQLMSSFEYFLVFSTTLSARVFASSFWEEHFIIEMRFS